MALLQAEGQLPSSSTTLLAASATGGERVVSGIFYNTSATEQTIILSLTPCGSTARTICRFKLERYEAAYVSGVTVDPAMLLSGYATSAAAVDYVITASPAAQFNILIRGADGTPKQSAEVTLTTTEKEGLTLGELMIVGVLEEMRDLLRVIA